MVVMVMETDTLLLGSQNAYLVKRSSHGGVAFSSDPLNLTNIHSRKVRLSHCQLEVRRLIYSQQAGFVNNKVWRARIPRGVPGTIADAMDRLWELSQLRATREASL